MSDCKHSMDEAEAVAGREGWCPYCLRDEAERLGTAASLHRQRGDKLHEEVEQLRAQLKHAALWHQASAGCSSGCPLEYFPEHLGRTTHEDEAAREPSCDRCGAGVWAGCQCYEEEDA